MKATKKPVTVEYFPVEDKYKEEIKKLSTKKRPVIIHSKCIEDVCKQSDDCETMIDYITIHTLEGEMKATNDDVIIVGINGEVYPCKRDIFEKTYNY